MDVLTELGDALRRKTDLFLQYEIETAALLTCETEKIEEHMRCREKLAAKIDRENAAIGKHVSNYVSECPQNGEKVRLAVKNQCGRGSLPGELLPIFDTAQRLFAIMHRVQRMELRAEDRFMHEEQILLGKIKKLNSGMSAKASKFYAGASGNTVYFPPAYKKV